MPKLTFLKVEFHVLISEFYHSLYHNHRLDNQDPFKFMRTSFKVPGLIYCIQSIQEICMNGMNRMKYRRID